MNKLLLTLLAGVVMAPSAYAQLGGIDSKPGDTCTAAEEGHIRRNASADRDISEITLICDGTNWQSATGGGGSSVWLNDGPGGPAAVYYNGGNVGIGTNDPTSKLDVRDGAIHLVGTTTTMGGFKMIPQDSGSYSNTADERSFYLMLTGMGAGDPNFGYKFSWRNADGTGRHDAMHFRSQGFIGIGTSFPKTRLDVGGTLRIWNGGELCNIADHEGAIRYVAASDAFQMCRNSATGWEAIGTGSGALPALASANIWVGNGSNAATAVAMSGDATLSNAGVLTIGSNAVGSVEITNASIALADLSATGTASATTYLRGDNTWATITGGDNLGNHTATANINLGTTRYLSPDGTNVGLTVAAGGSVNASGSVSGFGALPRDGSGDSWVFYNPTGDDMRLWRTTGGDALTILQNGNLGIGTAAPTQKLHVNGNAFRLSGTGANGAPEINLDNGTEFLGQSFQLRKDFAAKWVLKSVATGNDLGVFVDNNELRGLSIKTGTGNVGIGIAAPTEKLDVAGTVKATNFIGSGAGLTGISGDNLGAGGTTTGRITSTGGLAASQAMATATGGLGAIEATSQGSAGTAGAAFMSFHRPSAFAAYLGIDTDNQWKVGGWSMGAVAHKLWHAGNDGAGTGLDADTLDGLNSTVFMRNDVQNTSTGNFIINNGSPTLFFQDTDQRSAMLHNNGNQFYLLTGGINSTSWATNGATWPIQVDLTSDLVSIGGQLNMVEGSLNLGGQALISNAGTVIDSGGGWHRTYGDTGWYSQTHGGGWHMSDSTWIRSYGGKWIYTDTGIRADGNGVRTNQICDVNGGNCVAQGSLGGGGSVPAGTHCGARSVFYDAPAGNSGYLADASNYATTSRPCNGVTLTITVNTNPLSPNNCPAGYVGGRILGAVVDIFDEIEKKYYYTMTCFKT